MISAVPISRIQIPNKAPISTSPCYPPRRLPRNNSLCRTHSRWTFKRLEVPLLPLVTRISGLRRQNMVGKWNPFPPNCFSESPPPSLDSNRHKESREGHSRGSLPVSEFPLEKREPFPSGGMLKFLKIKKDQSLREFYIPDYIFEPQLEVEKLSYTPQCPVVVFINSKSGGQLGGELLITYRELLNKAQVFDLGEEAPDKVLHKLYANLEVLKLRGDELADQIQKRLRLIVAGGDGTAGWLLGVVCDLKLEHPPPVATVPLGTGNNLPFSFGWGKKNPMTDHQSVKSFLEQVMKAREMKIDSWHIIMRMRAPKEGSCDPVAPLELPHSLHAFHRVSSSDPLNMEGYHTFRGGFWNYFSMGMDAQVSYAFHSERKLHPEKFKNQLVNQVTYAKLVGSQGWFSASLSNSSSWNFAQLAKVMIMRRQGQWDELEIPQSIRSIICLNLPSFSGGLNPWGTPSKKKQRDRDLTPPYVDDGLLEVVGFRDAWHGLILLAPKGHGTRLAQARRIRFEFHKGAVDHTYMRIDGEPWKQPLPKDDDTVVVEISHHGQVNMLANPNCRSKSILDSSSSPMFSHHHDSDSSDSSDDEKAEEKRKFGAADTFKYPVEAQLSHFS